MDVQYHVCMIKPRLHDLVLAGVWPPRSASLGTHATIHAASHVDHEKRVVWFSISMHACGSVSIAMGLHFLWLWGSGGRQELCYKGGCIINCFRKNGRKE